VAKWDYYPLDNQGKRCGRCQVTKTLEDFNKNSAKKDGLQERCRDCQKGHYQTNDGPIKNRAFQLKRKYDLTLESYDKMFLEQEGKCLICKRCDERLVVDHCHTTGKVRGLLCSGCNRGLGFFNDRAENLQKAAEYLYDRQ